MVSASAVGRAIDEAGLLVSRHAEWPLQAPRWTEYEPEDARGHSAHPAGRDEARTALEASYCGTKVLSGPDAECCETLSRFPLRGGAAGPAIECAGLW